MRAPLRPAPTNEDVKRGGQGPIEFDESGQVGSVENGLTLIRALVEDVNSASGLGGYEGFARETVTIGIAGAAAMLQRVLSLVKEGELVVAASHSRRASEEWNSIPAR